MMASVAADGDAHATCLQQSPALTLGCAAPHAVVDPLVERVLEARLLDRARSAHAACNVDSDTVAGEEHRRSFLAAAPQHHPARIHPLALRALTIRKRMPVGLHFFLPRRTKSTRVSPFLRSRDGFPS